MTRSEIGQLLIRVVLLVAFVANLQPSVTAQGKYNKVLAIGDPAPGWQDLPGIDDQQHSMKDLRDIPVVVVCFTSNTCLYSIDYEDRLIELNRKYADAGQVRLIAVNSNAVKADDLEHMKERADEKQFPFPYLRDDDQSVAKAWGAVYTPEFFVLNQDREIVYMGAMDDSTKAEKVKQKYVELAIHAILKQEALTTTETPARGCAIRMPRRRKPVPDPISDR